MAITYLASGEQEKVERGIFPIMGYREDGSIIEGEMTEERKFIPGSQWDLPSHNATYQGSQLLNKVLGENRFSFPKSLYAVHDKIRFFVANKPNALIVDFFAGSDTTLHAVNLLNAEDGGNRRCIMVTNNEISADERKSFEARGIRQGEPEWEARGIARHVTWPRTVCSIKGHDVNGNSLKGNYIMVLLEAAVEEWQKKCRRWYQYTSEQHYANVDPVFVVQVCPSSGVELSATDLEDVLAKIEEKVGTPFKTGEVVHCFGESANVVLNGLDVPHVRASEIASDHRIKVVFFKEALSTGWDCPRAETMMSFAVRNDPTYIAQLLGRMIRTPLQMRVSRDEFLNDVKLYLPHFSRDNVKKVVDELQSNEGSEIPTEINGESLAEPLYTTWTVHTQRRQRGENPEQTVLPEFSGATQVPTPPALDGTDPASPTPEPTTVNGNAPEYVPLVTVTVPATASPQPTASAAPIIQGTQLAIRTKLDRVEVIDFINGKGFLTYFIRREQINDYLKSMLNLAALLTQYNVHPSARNEVIDDVIGMIRDYIDGLHCTGKYDDLARQMLQFKLAVQVFDPFGNALIENYSSNYTLFSENDLDRQLQNADAVLGKFGFANIYGGRYYDDDDPNSYKIDFVLFAADDDCRAKMHAYAKRKLQDFVGRYRVRIANSNNDTLKKKWHDILADSDEVSEQNFTIPENIIVREDPDGTEYDDHLLASEQTGVAKIKLNGWESALIEEEARRIDFVCWLRNPSRATWALCLPYEIGGEKKSFYPDFLIVRSDPELDYVVDILETHGDQYADNLPKAKALAEYAKKEDRIGRIQLIHKSTDGAGNIRFKRLDLTDMTTREKVLRANNDDELKNIFVTDGIFE